MAEKNIKVGLQLGVLGGSALKTAFGQTRREVQSLKTSTDTLTRASKAAGDAQVVFAAKGRAALASLKGSYDGLIASLGGLRTAAMALAAVPVAMGLNKALDLQDISIDLAMGMNLGQGAEAELALMIQNASSSGNQGQSDTGTAAQALVAGGVRELETLGDYLPVLTQSATATRVGLADLSRASLALRDNLGQDAAGFQRSMNMLSHASTQGKMGVEGMVTALPGLSLRLKSLPDEIGMSADEMMADLVAGLQVARLGANSDEEAARNLDAFMYRIFSPETGKRFESAGINLEKSIQNLTAQGQSPMEAMLDTITKYVGARGGGALKDFNAALAMEKGEAQDAAFSALSSRYALGDLFVDEGVKNFMIAAMQHRDMLQDLKQDTLAAAGQDLISEDFARRMTSGKEQLKQLRIQLGNIGTTLAGPLAGALVSTMHTMMPVIQGFAQWAQDNPGLVKGLLLIAGGFAGLRLRVMAVGVVARLGAVVLGVFNGALSGVMNGARMLLPVLAGLSWPVLAIGAAVAVVAALVWKFWEPIKAFMVGVWQGLSTAMMPVMDAFRSALAPLMPLWNGLAAAIGSVWGWVKGLFTPFQAASEQLQGATSAGQTFGAVLGQVLGVLLAPLQLVASIIGWVAGKVVEHWDSIKVALSWTPLGMIVTHWEAITGFFSGIWQRIAEAFAGGIEGVSALILDWSPLGLFYNAFAGVMDWFGVELPDSFSEFGSMLIDGLVSGITGAFGAAKDAVLGLGKSIAGWFGAELDIHSPSRVFMQLGGFVSEGAALGIRQYIPQAGEAVAELSAAVVTAGRDLRAPPVHLNAPATGASASAGHIQFSPTIHIIAAPGDNVERQVQRGLRVGMDEFRRMLREVVYQDQRTAFAGLTF